MIVGNVMQQIADRAATIAGLTNAFGYPAPKVVPPAVTVTYPEQITFDETYGRGHDSMTLGLVLFVGKAEIASTRDAVGQYCDGAGAKSVKAVLEAGTYTAFEVVTVKGVTFDYYTEAGTPYLVAVFDLEVMGKGLS